MHVSPPKSNSCTEQINKPNSEKPSTPCSPVPPSVNSQTLDPASTLNDPGYVPFWNTACSDESKQLWLPTVTGSVGSASSSSNGCWENMTPDSWFSIRRLRTHLTASQKISWRSSRCSQLVRTVCESTSEHLIQSPRAPPPVCPTRNENDHCRIPMTKPKLTKEERKLQQRARKEIRIANARAREQDKLKRRHETHDEKVVSVTKRRKRTREKTTTTEGPVVNKRRVKCKEDLTLYPQRERTLPQVTDDLQHPDLQKESATASFTHKFKLNPTPAQRRILRSYLGAYRYTYNEMVSIYKDRPRCQELFGLDRPPSTQDARESVMERVNETPTLAWVKGVPYNLRELAPREYASATKVAAKLRSGGHGGFEMRYKSLKRDRIQTIPLGARCVFLSHQGVKIFPRVNREHFAWKGKPFHGSKKRVAALRQLIETDPSPSKHGTHPPMQCKLVYDKGTREYAIHVPMHRQQLWAKPVDATHTENQGCVDYKAIALDPGVRTFLCGYSPDGTIIEFGAGDAGRLCRLSAMIDKLTSRLTDTNVRHHERQRLRRVRFRVHSKIQHLVAEMHWKSADYLCRHYDVILLPTFGTQPMVKRVRSGKRRHRKINRNTARKMLMMSHYRFRLRLLHKARQWGRAVIIVNEAFTSKTCTGCGWRNDTLDRSRVFHCDQCHLHVGRDINGARNILLRNLFRNGCT